ncbi:MAG: type II toxin-antitoxin system RelE/ParE family toxin [Mariprofundaceae bacterium]|nr:type II toxin-antitoxin system RelE/ParE family toxin [Mariprofundaceae bacterium]
MAQYTKKTWGEKQKKFYISQLRQSFPEVCANTQLGKLHSDLHPNLQAFHSQKHTFFYLAKERELYIIRVLHQNMDIETHLSRIK